MKTIKKGNFRVVVFPRTKFYGIRVEDEEAVCKDIEADIKRHVDNVGAVYIVRDEDAVCSHCGSPWTEDGDTFNGGCCYEDQFKEDARGNQSAPDRYRQNRRSVKCQQKSNGQKTQ